MPVSTPASEARPSAGASGLFDATHATSIPSRPWSSSRMAWRFVPFPEARTAMRNEPKLRRGSATGGDDGKLLQRELAVTGAVVPEGVVAREARIAVRGRRHPDRLVHGLQRQVGQRVRPKFGRDLLDGTLFRSSP